MATSNFNAKTDITALTGTDFAKLTAADLGQLNKTQAALLTADQLSGLSATTLPAITGVLKYIPASELSGISLKAITGLTLKGLTNDQFKALSVDQLGALTSTQVASIPKAQLGLLDGKADAVAALNIAGVSDVNLDILVNDLSVKQIAKLSSAQISGLSPIQISSLTADQAAALTPAQAPFFKSLASLSILDTASTDAALQNMDAKFIAALPAKVFSSLSTTQLEVLSDTQAAVLNSSHIQSLTADKIAHLGHLGENVAVLSPSAIAGLTKNNINAFDFKLLSGDGQFAALTSLQLGALSNGQVEAITADQAGSLTSTQLSAISSTQIVHLSNDAIAALQPKIISALNPKAISVLGTGSTLLGEVSALTSDQTPYLTSAQIKALSLNQLAKFTADEISVLSPAALAAIPSTVVSSIAPDVFSSLTTAQVAALTPAQFTNLSATTNGQLAHLTADQAIAITSAQIKGLNGTSIFALTPDAILALKPATLAAISSTAIGSISAATFSSLTSMQIAALTPAQFGELDHTANTGQLAQMGSDQAVGINSAQIKKLDANDIAALTSETVAALSPTTLAAVEPSTFSQLTPIAFSALSSKQVAALTPAQCNQLTNLQILQFGADQAAGLTTAQFAKIQPAIVAAIPSDAFSALKPSIIQSLDFTNFTNTQVSYLSPEQSAAISSKQINLLDASDLAGLDADTLAAIKPDSFKGLKGSFVGSSNTETAAINGLSVDALSAITTAQLAALSTAQLESLQANKIKYLSDNAIAWLSSKGYTTITNSGQTSGIRTSTTANSSDTASVITAGKKAVSINGSSHADTIVGSPANDTITGGGGNDSIDAGAGNDTIVFTSSSDLIDGSDGKDTLKIIADAALGADSNLVNVEQITITASANVSLATQSEDLIITATDNSAHTIVAGLGNDSITGGSGADTFAFIPSASLIGASLDTITNYVSDTDSLQFINANGVAVSIALPSVDTSVTVSGSNVQINNVGLITFNSLDTTYSKKVTAIEADEGLNAAGKVALFISGTDSYVYYSGASTSDSDDQIIKLAKTSGTGLKLGSQNIITSVNLSVSDSQATAQAVEQAAIEKAAAEQKAIEDARIAAARAIEDARDRTPPTITLNGSLITDTGLVTTIQNNDITKDNTIGLSGYVSDDVAVSSVQIYDGTTVLAGGVTIVNGSWTYITPVLSDGQHNFKAIAVDSSGNSNFSNSISLTVDTVAPNAPAISVTGNISDGINAMEVSNGILITVSLVNTGAVSGDTVNVSVDGVKTSFPLQTADIQAGVANVTISSAILTSAGQGDATITATLTDVAGNVSEVTKLPALQVDTEAPAKPVATSITESNTYDSTPTIQIAANLTDTVKVYVNNTLTLTTYNSTEGTLIFQNPLKDGDNAITYTLTDAAGNESVPSDSMNIHVIRKVTIDNVSSSNQPLFISGRAETNANVRLTLNSNMTVNVNADENGNWTYDGSVRYIMIRKILQPLETTALNFDANGIFTVGDISIYDKFGSLVPTSNISVSSSIGFTGDWNPTKATGSLLDGNHIKSTSFSEAWGKDINPTTGGEAWVQFNLGSSYPLSKITVFARDAFGARLNNAQIFTSVNDMSQKMTNQLNADSNVNVISPINNLVNFPYDDPTIPVQKVDFQFLLQNIIATETVSGLSNSTNATVNNNGTSGNDTIVGGDADDHIDGGEGSDSISGGSGIDTLTGGNGNDIFALNLGSQSISSSNVTDVITDFASGSDKIDFGISSSGIQFVSQTSVVSNLAALLTAVNGINDTAPNKTDGKILFYFGVIASDGYLVTEDDAGVINNIIQLSGVTTIDLTDIVKNS